MTPSDVKLYFKSCYRFQKETGMAASTYMNWMRRGEVPIASQFKLQEITNGRLKARESGVDEKGKLLFRFNMGSLNESMKTVVALYSIADLKEHIKKEYDFIHCSINWIEKYSLDPRINWDTYIVMGGSLLSSGLQGQIIGFLSGHPEIWPDFQSFMGGGK